MIEHVGHGGILRRIGINVGSGYVPGINAVITGAAQAAGLMGWEIVGILDGFEGLLHPERYPEGGLVTLSPQLTADLNPFEGGILGQSPTIDPFHTPAVNADNTVEEVDVSDEILRRLKEENLDALISVVGAPGLGVLHKLHRKGLHTVCIPKSLENDIAATSISFGFNSALSFTIDMLTRAKQAAKSARKIAVVEVIGVQAGWLALQAGIAVCADAVLLPEVHCNLNLLAQRLEERISRRRPYGLVIVAEGVKMLHKKPQEEEIESSRREALALRASLPPQALGEASEQVLIPSDKVAETVANELRLLLAMESYPLVVGPWARGGDPTAVDLQLGMAYGAGAIQALKSSRNGVMVCFVPPEIHYVPLAEAIDRVRTVPSDCEFVKIAESLGIYLGNFSSKKEPQQAVKTTNGSIDVYERLARVLDATPQGFPRMKSGVEIELLKLVFTLEEVLIAGHLTCSFESPAVIAKRAGLDEEDAIVILGGLISRKLVRMQGPPAYPGMPESPVGKDSKFRLGPFMIGWYEAVMRVEGTEFARLFHQYMQEGGGERILAPRPGVLGVVPVRGSLKPELMAVMEPHLDIDAHLQRHERFLVMDCVCKREMEAMGKADSRYPMKRCGFLGLPATTPLGEHVLSREDADRLLRRLENLGLVHNATYGFQMSAESPQYVGGCNCDRHTCGVFNNHYPSQASNYRSVIDPEKCVSCGVCIDRCPVNAIGEDEDFKAKVERAKCIGCGVCVIGCNDEAVELVPVSEEEWFHTPSSMEEWEELRQRNLDADKERVGTPQ